MNLPLTSISELRSCLANKKVSIGSWLQLGAPIAAEILANAGFDWLVIDEEHGSSNAHTEDILRSIANTPTLPFVRICRLCPSLAIRALEAGSAGIIVPNLTSEDEWRRFVSAVSYPPRGSRGVGFCRANKYGASFDSYFKFAQSPFLVPMIESTEGILALNKLHKDDSIDAIIIGPYDLSASLGCVGDFQNPRFTSAIADVLEICSHLDISAGIHVVMPDIDELTTRISQGFRFIAFGMDTTVLQSLRNPACSNAT